VVDAVYGIAFKDKMPCVPSIYLQVAGEFNGQKSMTQEA
jgi:hypothetical protein